MNWEGYPASVKVEGCDPGDSRRTRLQAIPDPRWIRSDRFLFKGDSHHGASSSQNTPDPKENDHHEKADGHIGSLDDFAQEAGMRAQRTEPECRLMPSVP